MARTWDIGDSVSLSWEVFEEDGTTPLDATVSLTVTRPDGTTTSPAVTHDGTGQYSATYTATSAGTHRFRWVATGAAVAAEEGAFQVRRQGSVVVSLDDFKRHLQKTAGTITSDDGELQDFLDTATEAAGVVLGVVLGASEYTETLPVEGYAQKLILSRYPVSAVTAVSVLPSLGGTATDYTSSDVTASTNGIVRLNSGTYWTGDVTVTYTAGQTDIPTRWATAIKIIGAHLWKTQRGAGGRPNVGAPPPDFDEVSQIAGLGYAIPNAALALLTHDPSGPVIA